MSTQKSKNIKMLIIGVAVLIAIVVISSELLKSDGSTTTTATDSLPVATTEPNTTDAIQPSAPKEISDRQAPLPIDAAEELVIGNAAPADHVVIAPSVMNSGPLTDKNLDDVFIAFSAEKTAASEKEMKKDARSGAKRTFGDTVDNGPVIAPPRFTAEQRRMSPMGSQVPLGANQTAVFNPPMMNGGIPAPGMIAAPVPEPVKTKVVFCADGECDEVTTQGTKKINPNAKNQQQTAKETLPNSVVKK